MNTRLRILAFAALVWLAPPATEAEVLRGHLSGLEDPHVRVDLRIRFFSSDTAENRLADRYFEGIELSGGQFRVRFGVAELPPGARFVEIAIRPSARRYAAFQDAPPRRRLRRSDDGTLIAGVADPTPDRSGDIEGR